jgi:Membrane domain of glycerophosphoryl diester phosphodiesterase
MTGNFESSASMQPLNVGNVVSAGMRLYRANLKDYFLIALKAYCWILIPIYGWAKFSALSALISSLAFGNLTNQPESIKNGQDFVNSRKWSFLGTLVLMTVARIVIVILSGIAYFIIGIGIESLIASFGQDSIAALVISNILGLLLGIVALLGILWFFTRFYLYDIPLAIEDDVDSLSTISRSWELTKGHVWRILLISFIAFLITFPLQIIIQVIANIVILAFAPAIANNSPLASLFYLLIIFFLISFSGGAIILPFWQAVKAVIYYDMRTRKEGLGLNLRQNHL